ncbi:SRPBCC domain-containing protein [Phytohabitans kaempferiae]|uniref:SRPBCC domain-containing protein n=1 Tax=Phytohabitans kaempferiae TaxID=1620943 RepID=A0ABV6LYA6_9ACTN
MARAGGAGSEGAALGTVRVSEKTARGGAFDSQATALGGERMARGGVFDSVGAGGERMAQSGVYREVEPDARLVLTEVFDDQSYPGETLITHEFVERAGRTDLTSTVRYATPEGRDRVLRYPMARGVGEGFDRLDQLLMEGIPDELDS